MHFSSSFTNACISDHQGDHWCLCVPDCHPTVLDKKTAPIVRCRSLSSSTITYGVPRQHSRILSSSMTCHNAVPLQESRVPWSIRLWKSVHCVLSLFLLAICTLYTRVHHWRIQMFQGDGGGVQQTLGCQSRKQLASDNGDNSSSKLYPSTSMNHMAEWGPHTRSEYLMVLKIMAFASSSFPTQYIVHIVVGIVAVLTLHAVCQGWWTTCEWDLCARTSLIMVSTTAFCISLWFDSWEQHLHRTDLHDCAWQFSNH